jgi:hypothetical protein
MAIIIPSHRSRSFIFSSSVTPASPSEESSYPAGAVPAHLLDQDDKITDDAIYKKMPLTHIALCVRGSGYENSESNEHLMIRVRRRLLIP